MFLLPMSSMAQKVAYAVLKDSTLTYYYDDKKPEGAYEVEKREMIKGYYQKLWHTSKEKISTVIFDKSFKEYKPSSCYNWFNGCSNLKHIIGMKEYLDTKEVKDMAGMFAYCSNLRKLDVSGFNTQNVEYMMAMFRFCTNLTNLDLSGFNTRNVRSMYFMFHSCSNLTNVNLNGFNIENVSTMAGMFSKCSNLTSINICSFITENVTDMWGMFADCATLKTIYVGDRWNPINVTNSESMFKNCNNLIGGQGTKYDENHTDVEYAHIDGGESNPGYLTKK